MQTEILNLRVPTDEARILKQAAAKCRVSANALGAEMVRARWRNAAKTALLAGHTEQTLFAHYREVVTSSAARSFWAILPEPGQG